MVSHVLFKKLTNSATTVQCTTDFNWHKSPASPACRQESKVEGCVLNFFYDSDSDELDLRGIAVTLLIKE